VGDSRTWTPRELGKRGGGNCVEENFTRGGGIKRREGVRNFTEYRKTICVKSGKVLKDSSYTKGGDPAEIRKEEEVSSFQRTSPPLGHASGKKDTLKKKIQKKDENPRIRPLVEKKNQTPARSLCGPENRKDRKGPAHFFYPHPRIKRASLKTVPHLSSTVDQRGRGAGEGKEETNKKKEKKKQSLLLNSCESRK